VAQGPNLAVFNAFPVDRTGLRGRHDLGTSLLDDGVPLLLFPEGTRSRTGEMGAFKPGAAALCISRDVPCLPVAIGGSCRGNALRPELADSRTAAGVCHLRRADAGEDGETVAQFSERITKEVSGLIDYATTYRANQA
jgi:1-acyl-sn-glycerol-3-phosphate acyltransferase